MSVATAPPVVAAVPLDDSASEVAAAALALARRLGTSVLPVHAIAPYPFPTARHDAADAARAREAVRAAFEALEVEGVRIEDPVIGESAAASWILDTALRVHAQMIVVGGGQGATVGSWLLGTVADRVTRGARCPVFIARGELPGPDGPVLCPVDLTPHSHLGLEAGLRMARLFGASLEVLTVLPEARGASLAGLEDEASRLERATHEELGMLLRSHDTRGVRFEVRVVGGDPAKRILEASQRASLVVVASRSFDTLVPASFGDVASRVVRGAHCPVFAVRDLDADPARRTAILERVVALRDESRQALERGELERAEVALRVASTLLPGHAAIEDDLATVCDRADRPDAADRHRRAARALRSLHA